MRLLYLASVAPLSIAAAALAQPPAGPVGHERVPAVPAATKGRAEAETGPVPVPEPSEEALRYYQSGNVLWLVDVAWGLLVPGLFLFSRLSARIRAWARRLGRWWFFVVGIYFLIFYTLYSLIGLPLDYYEGFVRPHAYGLSNQTLAKWAHDTLLAWLIGAATGVLFLWVPYLLLARSPRRWWLYTAALAVPFLFLVLLIEPIWIAPLFNQFGEMKDKPLEAKILALAHRAGIDSDRVYEVNKSVDTKTVNAYVTGFLNTKRIVLWDTLLAWHNDRQILFVMGHEMGHYVLGHVVQGMVLLSFLVLATLYAIHRSAGALIRRFQARFGFDRLADVASLPLLIVLVNLFVLIVSPAGLAFSRHIEHEADRFGLEITQDNRAAAEAFVRMEHENLAVPRPGQFYKLWRASHPPLGERIDFCNAYRPWEKGEPLKYGRLFHGPRSTRERGRGAGP